MKKLLATLVFGTVLSMTMALNANAEGVIGLIFKEATEAGGGASPIVATKVGSATAKSYFGIVALGDASITAAMKDGKIRSLSHYDIETLNILGFKKVTTKAYGQ
ncbi:MAG: TRL domain-containing protein [Candidatus Gastranaerophilales bacterium]|nr:TRL domain-containing protein [Candidatus Gastranaerophilales bacterium]